MTQCLVPLTSVYTPHLAVHVASSPGAAGAVQGRKKKKRDRGIVNCKAMEEHKRCRVEAFSKVQQQKIEWKK